MTRGAGHAGLAGASEWEFDPSHTTAQFSVKHMMVTTVRGTCGRLTFFDAKNHPNITFKSTKIQKAGKDKYKVTGDLTMRGVTKPVTLAVEGPSREMKNPWGMAVRAVSVTGKLNRKDWGLNWNTALEAGGVLVSDEVQLQIDASMIAKAPAAAQQ